MAIGEFVAGLSADGRHSGQRRRRADLCPAIFRVARDSLGADTSGKYCPPSENCRPRKASRFALCRPSDGDRLNAFAEAHLRASRFTGGLWLPIRTLFSEWCVSRQRVSTAADRPCDVKRNRATGCIWTGNVFVSLPELLYGMPERSAPEEIAELLTADFRAESC